MSTGTGKVQKVVLYDIPEASIDSMAQPSQATTAIGTFRARIRQIKGQEQVGSSQNYATRAYLVEMNWLGSAIPATATNSVYNPATGGAMGLILPQMVINTVLDNKWLRVESAENVDQANRQWKLVCIEKVGSQS